MLRILKYMSTSVFVAAVFWGMSAFCYAQDIDAEQDGPASETLQFQGSGQMPETGQDYPDGKNDYDAGTGPSHDQVYPSDKSSSSDATQPSGEEKYPGDLNNQGSSNGQKEALQSDNNSSSTEGVLNAVSPRYYTDEQGVVYGYAVNEEKVQLISCALPDNWNNEHQTLNVPKEIDNYPVVVVEQGCFNGQFTLEKIVLPSSVVRIGAEAFVGCPQLTTVVIQAVSCEIEAGAWKACAQLVSVCVPTSAQFSDLSVRTDLAQDCEVCIAYDFSLVKVEDVEDQEYEFYPIAPAVKVWFEEELLEQGTDYQISYSNNTEPGSAHILLTGIGDYLGEIETTFKIKKSADNVYVLPGSWASNSTGWWWQQTNGLYPYSDRFKVGTETFYFGPRGYIESGWKFLDSNWYFFNTEHHGHYGAMVSGWNYIDDNWYYFKPSGEMLTGWQLIDGTYYYLSSSGAMKTGWQYISGSWFFLNNVHDGTFGTMLTGWQYINGSWFYLNPLHDGTFGTMLTGWQYIDDEWYYLTSSGYMETGWMSDGSSWYHFSGSGNLESGWQYINGSWFYLNPLHDGTFGTMLTGWQYIDDEWYYLSSSGSMVTGWCNIAGSWYVFDWSGHMKHSVWEMSGHVWYYLGDSGAMCRGWQYFDGQWWRFDSAGHYRPQMSSSDLQYAVNQSSSSGYTSVYGGSISDEAKARIDADIDALWANGASVGFVLIDLTSGTVISSNAWQTYYAASSIKGTYVCAIASEWPSMAWANSGAIYNTINWSSNDDYEYLWATCGKGIFTSYKMKAGVPSVTSNYAWVSMRAADQAKLWVQNYNTLSEDTDVTSWLQPYYKHTKMSFIDASLGSTYDVYSKAGWIWYGDIWYVYDDAGFVDKDGHPYVLAVMSDATMSSRGILEQLVWDLDLAHSELY